MGAADNRDWLGEARSKPPPSNGLALLVLGLLVVVLIGSLAVAAWSSGLWGRKNAPALGAAQQIVVVTNVVVQVVPAPPAAAAPADLSHEHSTPRAASAPASLGAYRDALSSGKLDWASNRLAEARSALVEIKTLKLYRLCASCTGVTACAACAGSGACSACRGGRRCLACKGRPKGPPQVCAACEGLQCQACGGRTRCAACQGYGTLRCERCRGIGNVRIDFQGACASCGGKGEKPGLRRSDGTSLALPCPLCGSSGRVTKTELRDCLICGKKGRVACEACRGGGRCVACGGSGKRKEACGVCRGSGITHDVCQACQGAGTCGSCGGAGRCEGCGGRRESVCRACASRGVFEAGRFPVSAGWLKVTNGCWLVCGEGLRRAEPASGAVALPDRRIAWSGTLAPDEVVVFLPSSQPHCAPLFKPQ